MVGVICVTPRFATSSSSSNDCIAKAVLVCLRHERNDVREIEQIADFDVEVQILGVVAMTFLKVKAREVCWVVVGCDCDMKWKVVVEVDS